MTLNKIEKGTQSTQESINRMTESLVLEGRANRLVGDIPELEDASYISAFVAGEDFHITFNLDSEKKDSKLIHKLAQRFGVKFIKSKSLFGQGLDATAETPDGVHLKIQGYVPATCRIITEEVDLPEDEWVTVKSKTVTRTECSEPVGEGEEI